MIRLHVDLDGINARDRDVAGLIEKVYRPGLAAADDLRAVGYSMLTAGTAAG